MKRIKITPELLAAFVSGNTTDLETMAVIKAAESNDVLRSVLDFSDKLDEKYYSRASS